jgi:acetyltransferase-like isoleucine patch superfamily enzyme
MLKKNMFRHYGLIGISRLIISKIYTLLCIPKARLIRLPIDIRYQKNIFWGEGLTTGFGCRFEAYNYGNIKTNILIFGNNIEIGDYVHIAAGEHISIGNNVLMASKIFITDMSHGCYSGKNNDTPLSTPNIRKISIKHVVIEENVWIGESVSILPGVTIGKGSIIGANSLVSRSIPPFTIAVGNPAKPIKKFDFLHNQWVNY